jgi:phosphatidylglycerophosphatase GEP4
VGDRVFTDVVMANRMAAKSENGKGPLAILTTGVWTRESMGMRWCEAKLVEAVKRWTSGGSDSVETRHVERFIRDPTITKTKPEPVSFWKRIGLRFGS